jgi:VWFA-related protein
MSYRDEVSEEELDILNIRTLEADLFRKLRDFRYIDERKLFVIADYFRKLEGQKHIFLFYQKEELPIPPELDRFESLKDASLDVMKVRQAFSDSTMSIHFVFVTKKAVEELDVERMRLDSLPLADVSAPIFNAFREIAESTGGTISASANLSASFQRAVDATESYYLLYYSPLDYKKDGKYRKIEVKVKDRNYKILHREGYFSN